MLGLESPPVGAGRVPDVQQDKAVAVEPVQLRDPCPLVALSLSRLPVLCRLRLTYGPPPSEGGEPVAGTAERVLAGAHQC